MFKTFLLFFIILCSDLNASTWLDARNWLRNIFPIPQTRLSNVGLTSKEEDTLQKCSGDEHSAKVIDILESTSKNIELALKNNNYDAYIYHEIKLWLMQTALTPLEYRERKFRLPPSTECKTCPYIALDNFDQLVKEKIFDSNFPKSGIVKFANRPHPHDIIQTHFKPKNPYDLIVLRAGIEDFGGDILDHYAPCTIHEFNTFAYVLYSNGFPGTKRCWI